MEYLINWDEVQPDRWTYGGRSDDIDIRVFELKQLPDFTNARFGYLGKEADKRPAEIAKRQMQMVRAFHHLGSGCGISLRLLKNQGITAYLVFRYSKSNRLQEKELKSILMREYSFSSSSGDEIRDISWAEEAAEVIKQENLETGSVYPENRGRQIFYTPYMWSPAENNMEYICRNLMDYPGKALVEITIVPTEFLEAEKSWLNMHVGRMKDSMNGETIRTPDGKRILWRGNPIPGLKVPIENCEKMNKQYETSSIFMTSIRVFAQYHARSLAEALAVNSVKNPAQIYSVARGSKVYEALFNGYRNVDVTPQLHNNYWDVYKDSAPFRAQRLSKLASVEEISNFFRIPIPVNANFPGFAYDAGFGTTAGIGAMHHAIRLGNYIDDHGQNEAASFDVKQLAKHGLIVGVPGSGKTTAMFNILHQLWDAPEEERIPFIILEPAKTEYRALKGLPEFRKDMLVFTLGDEATSPFRFNPMEVLPGIRLENHISKLQACFVGAFDLFDPLPIFLEQAIRRTYEEKGWYDDSIGGEMGLETPTLTDLCRNAEYVVSHSGFDAKMRSDFQASLLERLSSLRKGSKGRMLDTPHTIPMEELMNRPVVLELDSLNSDEKSLMMMFLLNYVFEYCKVKRKSGSPLKHMLLVEEAHNLIPSGGNGSDNRANPKEKTIELFINMLAEMRSLGQGILIADQLPTAIAPQAVKQTNVKILMRVTAKDDREEIGNTMDLNEEQMHQVINFKTGHAYLYHEGEDHVRMLRMLNYKQEHQVEEPQSDPELREIMADYEDTHKNLYMPYRQCRFCCDKCDRRVRNQAELLVRRTFLSPKADIYTDIFGHLAGKMKDVLCVQDLLMRKAQVDANSIRERYGHIGLAYGPCVYIQAVNQVPDVLFDQKNLCIGGKKRTRDDRAALIQFANVTKGE